MKQTNFFSLVLGLFAILGVGTLMSARAQTQPGTLLGDSLDITQRAIAFVKAEVGSASRSILYIKRPNAPVDRYDLAAIVNQIYQVTAIDSIRHLSVIGMTPNGDRLVLGAEVTFLNTSNGQHQTFYGILQIPWPLTAASLVTGDLTTLFLQVAPDIGSFHPAGILSPDGSQWYATMRTSSQGSDTMRFYHGRVTGGAVDSATITGDVTGTVPPEGSWNISNLALDTTTGGTPTLLAAEVDGLQSSGNQSERVMIMHWHPGDAVPFANDISGKLKNMQAVQDTIDALFGVTVAALQQNASLEIGLRDINSHDGTIEFYTTSYNASNGLTRGQTIPNSILPPATTFFAGRNSSQYSDNNSHFSHVNAQGGDVILTNNGSTALFITREVPDNPDVSPRSQRNVKSAIFSYDLSGSSPAKMLYNDSNAQELQPIFIPSKDTTPHVPDIKANATILKFGTVDTALTATKIVTITDTSVFDGTILDAATITGDNEFTIIYPKFPDTLKRNTYVQVEVMFSPVATAGARNATLTVTSAMSVTKSLSVTLNGTAAVLPPNGVQEDAALAQSMSIEPNPFSSIASVRLTAQDAGALGIVVHDALGRTIYTSPLQHVGIGASETFDFDAKSLGLPNGIYYVTALFGDRQVSRQVVFVR